MNISKLLNPFCGDRHGYRSSESPARAPCPVGSSAVSRRLKVPKDAPIFSEGNKTVGHVNFPPHEAVDDHNLVAQHREFRIYPLGEIRTKGVRHIPYNSDKKDFMDKTGRDAFEMFQYTYKRPGEDKEYTVVWDYNVGLVRMTPFFKSCKYSKTTPAKALNQNRGLKDISYSITGGALVCQGYWMPYHAAKAIAATFCYDIRWALTPVFGNDFPSLCLSTKHPSFAKFQIEPAIVQYCTMETDRFRKEGLAYRVLTSNVSSPIEPPKAHFGSPPTNVKGQKQRRLQPAADIESGYGTDTERSDKYFMSPQVSPRSQPVSPRSQFTPINRSRSPPSPYTASSPVDGRNAQIVLDVASRPVVYCEEPFRTKRTHSKVAFCDEGENENSSRPQTAHPVRYDSAQECDDSGDKSVLTREDMDAAEGLLSLSAGDNKLPLTKRTRRGSKY